MSTKKHPNEGTSLDDFLKEEGVYEECNAKAAEEAIAWQLQQAQAAAGAGLGRGAAALAGRHKEKPEDL